MNGWTRFFHLFGRTTRHRVYGLALFALLIPLAVWVYALSEVVTRDSNQTPCAAVDDSTGECRNLRYNAASKGLDVNLVGSASVTVGSLSGSNTPADAFSNPTNAIPSQSFTELWNGAAWDRARSASATSLTSGISAGATTIEKGPRWSVFHAPAATSQATASKSAGAGGVRHVADCISYSIGGATAPAATALTLNLRDGASGAGNILWTKTLVAAATAAEHADGNICGLNLVGSAATAMTLEFAAGLTNESESVTLTGFDVQ